MKKAIGRYVSVLFILLLVASSLSAVELGDERKRIYLIGGIGYCTSSVNEGLGAELGAEVRLFGKVHARLMLDYFDNRSGDRKNGELIDYSAAINLYALYKVRLSDTWNFHLKLGGIYSSIKSDITAFGVTYSARETHYGIGAGLGLEWQLSNRFYVYFAGTAKYILTDNPTTWVIFTGGILYRLK